MKKPLFVTFEGGEGAGKTTLIRRLEQELDRRGYPSLSTREPGGTVLGDKIRNLLLQTDEKMPISPIAELLLFLTGRVQHLEETIRPALKRGFVVLCDRFNDSSVAYQGIARGLGQVYVQSLCDQVCQNTHPDLTFFLDLDPAIGMQRAHKEQRVMDRLENEKGVFHQRVREGFLKLARENPHRITVVDASSSPDEVFTQVWGILSKKLMAAHV